MALTDDIIAHYRLNGDFSDAFALQADFTGSGSPAFDAGKIDDAAFFNGFHGSGAGSFAQLTAPAFDFDLGPVTITGWCWVDSTSGDPGILSNWGNSGGVVQWLFWVEGGDLKFQVRPSAGPDIVADFGPVPEDQWFHFSLQYDPGNEISLRVDNGTAVTAAIATGVATGTTIVEIANRNGAGAPLAGAVDALAFWSRLLNGTELGQVYNAGTGLEIDPVPALDSFGLKVEYKRRDYLTANEVDSVLTDDVDLLTEYRGILTNDPDGTPDVLITTAWADQNFVTFNRTKILRELNGAIPSRVRVEIEARHEHEEELFTSLQTLTHDLDVVSSDLADDQNLGLLDDTEVSPVFTVPDSGDYEVTLGTALTGIVEYRLNGGSWTTVIAAGLRLGRILALTATDDLEFRHSQAGPGTAETILQVRPPVSTAGAYAVLIL